MKKRSTQVALVMLGAAAMLSACSPSEDDVEIKQEAYVTQEDCQADWGNEPQQSFWHHCPLALAC